MGFDRTLVLTVAAELLAIAGIVLAVSKALDRLRRHRRDRRVRSGFRAGLAWVSYRAALLLGRPVPEDGLPLGPDEAHDFIDAARGWDLPAFEPAREIWRQR